MDKRNLENVVAAVLFGSVARGDDNLQSDLDLLVVINDRESRDAISDSIMRHHRAATLPLVLTVKSLLEEVGSRPSFIAHLLDEGVVVHATEGWIPLRAALERLVADDHALAREVRSRARDLVPLSSVERFRSSPITALSHIYGVSRSLVIARLLQAGIHEYRWQRAFDRYAEIRPELSSDIEALKALRPYYEYARARKGACLPALSIGPEQLKKLVHAAEQLVS